MKLHNNATVTHAAQTRTVFKATRLHTGVPVRPTHTLQSVLAELTSCSRIIRLYRLLTNLNLYLVSTTQGCDAAFHHTLDSVPYSNVEAGSPFTSLSTEASCSVWIA